MRRKIHFILVFILFCIFVKITSVADEIPFKGSRTLVCVLDRSDINNFVDGGLEKFEQVLDENKIEWLDLKEEILDRDMKLTLTFSFENKLEYEERMRELLGYRPVIIYETGNDFILAENFDSGEILNFIQSKLLEENMLDEFNFSRLLSVQNCTLILNEKKYETTENFDIRNGTEKIQFDSMDIFTTANSDGSFERTINIMIKNGNWTDNIKTVIKNNFSKAGTVEEEDNTSLDFAMQVKIQAKNQEELCRKTIIATGFTERLIEKEKAENEKKFVECEEHLGIDKVLRKDGVYNYDFIYPSYYQELQIQEKDSLSLEENELKYSGEDGKFSYSYYRGAKIEKIKISTDMSNLIKGTERKIQIRIPKSELDVFEDVIFEHLHQIKEERKHIKIEKELGEDYKEYSISCRSRKSEELQEFTEAVLRGNNRFSYVNRILPIRNGTLIDSITVGDIVPAMIPLSEMEIIYLFPNKTKIISSNDVEYQFNKNQYKTTEENKEYLNAIVYRTLNIIDNIIILSIILLGLIVVFILLIKRKWRKR